MTTEVKGEMTTMQQIIKTDFDGNIPTLTKIIAKFPPAEETFTVGNKEIITFSRMVSRASNGAIIYIAPPKKA